MSNPYYPITGRVLRPDHQPAADAVVTIVESSIPLPEFAQEVNEAGGFRMSLPAGVFVIEARAGDGALAGRITLEIPGRRTEAEIEAVIVVGPRI